MAKKNKEEETVWTNQVYKDALMKMKLNNDILCDFRKIREYMKKNHNLYGNRFEHLNDMINDLEDLDLVLRERLEESRKLTEEDEVEKEEE